MSSTNVIEWVNPRLEDIIWRYPSEDIRWGSALVVHEYESAIFMRDGKLYDVFGPGRHVLSTQNLPLLTRAYRFIWGYGETPFKATVVFVALKQFQGTFGFNTMVPMDQTVRSPIPLLSHGEFWFRVENATLFLTQVLGGLSQYTTDEVQMFLRGFVKERAIEQLARYDFMTVYTKLGEVSRHVKVNIEEVFRNRGMELVDLKLDGVATTKDFQDKVFWMQSTRSASEVLRMETVRKVAEELGKSPGAALGSGMVLIPPMFQQPATSAPAPSYVSCPRCHAQVSGAQRYCGECGAAIFGAPTLKCPKCGQDNPSGQKYCTNCGQYIT